MTRFLSRATAMAFGLLVLAELFFRLFYQNSISGRFDYGYSPSAGFDERVDGTVALVRAGGRRFLPQAYPRERPAGTFRIMVVGDSVPRGTGVANSYVGQLAALVRSNGVSAEGWNLCVAGYGARRDQVVLRQALRYHPSVVILHLNDSNEFEDEREYRRSQEFSSWHPKNWLMKSFVIRRLYEAKTEKVYWELLPEAVRTRQGVNDAEAEVAASTNPDTVKRWAERVRTITAESVELCRAAGVPVILLSQARMEKLAGGGAALEDHGLDALVNAHRGTGVATLSMKEALIKRDFVPLFADSAHLHPSGHRLLADSLLELCRPWFPARP